MMINSGYFPEIQCTNNFYRIGLLSLITEMKGQLKRRNYSAIKIIVLPDDTVNTVTEMARWLTGRTMKHIILLCSPLQRSIINGFIGSHVTVISSDTNIYNLLEILNQPEKQSPPRTYISAVDERNLMKYVNRAAALYNQDTQNIRYNHNYAAKYSLMKKYKLNNSIELNIKTLLSQKILECISRRDDIYHREFIRDKNLFALAETRIYLDLQNTKLAFT